jgi:hypothetical protein
MRDFHERSRMTCPESRFIGIEGIFRAVIASPDKSGRGNLRKSLYLSWLIYVVHL